jgi:hypothetical protein
MIALGKIKQFSHLGVTNLQEIKLLNWNKCFSTCEKRNLMFMVWFHSYPLTLNLLTTTIVAPPSNASKWQMGFNSAFKGLISTAYEPICDVILHSSYNNCHVLLTRWRKNELTMFSLRSSTVLRGTCCLQLPSSWTYILGWCTVSTGKYITRELSVSQVSVTGYHFTGFKIPQDSNLYQHGCENLILC